MTLHAPLILVLTLTAGIFCLSPDGGIRHRETTTLPMRPSAESTQALPQPVAAWSFQLSRIRDGELVALVGPGLHMSGFPQAKEGGLRLEGPWDCAIYPWNRWKQWADFPTEAFTIDLAVRRDAADGETGLAGCIFATKDGLRGWTLNGEGADVVFTVATERGIRSVRARSAPTRRFVTLTAAYDQARISLYVDGVLAEAADAPLGPIALNGRTPFAVGGWWQGDKTLGFSGIVRSYALYGVALSAAQVARLPEVRARKTPPLPENDSSRPWSFTIAPTIQQVSTDEATIVWEGSGKASAEVRFGEGGRLDQVRKSEVNRIHKVRLPNLKPGTTYSFQVHISPETGAAIESETAAFTTLPLAGQPIRFAVVGDTQDHPETNARVARGMKSHDPAFALIIGDLVGTGWEKSQWVDDFFGSMRPLFATVPLFPLPGNHDRNAMLYYQLLALPKPYYCYAFRAGDAEIFTLDTEHPVEPGSEQYRWLETRLKKSTARWKIVAHHYPPYSSDLDDYGDDFGDTAARMLTPLYDRYDVDLVLSGHIHSYERTHPLRDGKVTDAGPIYLVIGGGGGDLEQFLPNPPAFSSVRKSAHHYAIFDVTPESLTVTAYDLSGAVFDTLRLRK